MKRTNVFVFNLGSLVAIGGDQQIFLFIQTGAERGRSEAVVNRKRAQVIYVCKCMCKLACMYILEDFSGLRALTDLRVVPYYRAVDKTNLARVFFLAQWVFQQRA